MGGVARNFISGKPLPKLLSDLSPSSIPHLVHPHRLCHIFCLPHALFSPEQLAAANLAENHHQSRHLIAIRENNKKNSCYLLNKMPLIFNNLSSLFIIKHKTQTSDISSPVIFFISLVEQKTHQTPSQTHLVESVEKSNFHVQNPLSL